MLLRYLFETDWFSGNNGIPLVSNSLCLSRWRQYSGESFLMEESAGRYFLLSRLQVTRGLPSLLQVFAPECPSQRLVWSRAAQNTCTPPLKTLWEYQCNKAGQEGDVLTSFHPAWALQVKETPCPWLPVSHVLSAIISPKTKGNSVC